MQVPSQPSPPVSDLPKRGRTRRKDARPAEIIGAAMALWSERGFAATRLEDVASAAGVAKGTIYLYFRSKEALFEAALRDRLVSMMEATGEGLAQFEGSTEAFLKRFFRAVRARLFDEGAIVLLRVLLGEGHHFPALVKLYREVALTRGLQTAKDILARGVARGELRPAAAALDPRLLMAPIVVGALMANLFEDALPPIDEAYIDAHVDTLMHGLSRR